MANVEINKYIKKRYNRWLDYAKYHTSQAGLQGEAVDVLNEVLLSLLKKDEDYILKLLRSKKSKYCELDFFILRMIKFNSTSVTAPYLAKHKPMPVDRNVNLMNLDIEDMKEHEIDKSKEFLDNHQTVCKIADRLDLNKIEKDVFHHVFVMQEPLPEHEKYHDLKKQMYDCYSSIRTAVTVILFQEGKTKIYPEKEITGRAKNLINQYYLAKTY